jgi:hypothetical protein
MPLHQVTLRTAQTLGGIFQFISTCLILRSASAVGDNKYKKTVAKEALDVLRSWEWTEEGLTDL